MSEPAILAHTLVAADPERVRAFVTGYGAMARAVARGGTEAAASGEAQSSLWRLLSTWSVQDHARQVADRVEVAGDGWRVIERGLRDALEQLDYVDDLEREDVERTLRGALGGVGMIPRATQHALEESVERLARMRELGGPAIFLGNEAVLLARKLEGWRSPPPPWDETPDWSRGCAGLLRVGLEACLRDGPSGRDVVELGLGVSDVAELLGVDVGQLDAASREDALETLVPALGAAPLVPRGRVHALGPTFLAVRDHGEGIGPIGWAAGDDLGALVTEYNALAREHRRRYGPLERVAGALSEARRCGDAVVGCIEVLPPESEGHRNWLVAP
ncbi:hypothetical protein [Sandaracinus amylolyticus]|uniref:hypothetical protein n=1 Tax=Sandaracinus amylolyticus TaxID=927083 RepID=UPI001F2EB276|nr:hypothetical protein [Sandaracinus amylolyticus]UJR81567.1 Hypothetical protein I5071_36270 [Sandaracinus amylolyticus]